MARGNLPLPARFAGGQVFASTVIWVNRSLMTDGDVDVKIAMTVLCAMLLSMPASAHDECPKAACEKVKQKIRKIESKMRQAYSRAQGEKMSARLRELRAVRSKTCR